MKKENFILPQKTVDKKPLRIGTRNSPLAIIQANIAISAIAKVSTDNIIIVPISQQRTVKRIQLIPRSVLSSFQQHIQKARFVTHLEESLLNKEIDIAVHSLKDLATQKRAGLLSDCFLPRGCPHDTLINEHYTINTLPSGSLIGTSSPRRTAQIKAFRSDIKPVPLQGNVGTRLAWCHKIPQRSVILAEAGLKRLEKNEIIRHTLPLDTFLPAGGQGIISLQYRVDDKYIKKILRRVTDITTSLCANIERDFLFYLGASCLSPVGILASIDDENVTVHCAVWQPDGKNVWQQKKCFPLEKILKKQKIGKFFAEIFLKKAPTKLLDFASLNH